MKKLMHIATQMYDYHIMVELENKIHVIIPDVCQLSQLFLTPLDLTKTDLETLMQMNFDKHWSHSDTDCEFTSLEVHRGERDEQCWLKGFLL